MTAAARPVILDVPPAPEPVPTIADRAVMPLRIVAGLLALAAIWWAQAFLIPVVFSVIVSYALEPAVARMERWHIKRAIGVPLLLLILIVVTASGAYALRGEAVAFANRLPSAARSVTRAIRSAVPDRDGTVAKVQQAATELERAAAATRTPRTDGVTSVRVEEPTFRWTSWLWQGSQGAMEFGGQLFAIVCLVYYLMAAGDLYRRKIVRIVGTSLSQKRITVQILAEIDRQIERFLWARAVISAVVGAAVWVTFRLLGLEEPGVWAVLSALLFAIPIVGPAVIVVGAGLAGFVQFGTMGPALLAAGACLVIAAIEGNILTPWLMSRVGEMNSVAVFVSLMFWGWIWGVWGLLLAVPITAAVKAVCERVEDWNGVAELLKE